MKTNIKVPQELRRAATITAEPSGDFSMSISSTEPYKRYDYWNDKEYYEVLDHSPGGMDDSRLKGGLPILFNHDRDQHLGRATKYENDGKRCSVSGLIWSESEFAQTKKKDALSGALPDTSVGYRIIGEGKQIGTRDGIPVLSFKWAIHEASLVTIPADPSVGVGRDLEKLRSLPFDLIAIDLQKEIDGEGEKVQTQPKMKLHELPKRLLDKADDQGGSAQIDVSKERNEAVTAERSRVAKIEELSTHFRDKGLGGRKIDTSELARQFVAQGKTEQDFRNAVMEGTFKDAQPAVTTVAEVGMNEKEKRSFSIVRAMRCLANKRPLDGLEKEATEAHAKLIGKEAEAGGFFLPQDVMNARAFPNGSVEQLRALFTNVYSAAGATVGTDLLGASMIELLRNQMRVVQMGARTLSGLRGNVAIPRQTGGATASWLAEDATITASNQTVGQLGLTPHRLGAATAYTLQLLAQSSIDIENFVRQDLMAVIALARDLAAIAGTGVSGQPLGIINTPNLSTNVTLSAAQSMTYANAVQFETNVSLNNANLGKLGYMTTPTAKNNSKLIAEISAANSIPVWKDDKVNGYPALATNQVPTAQGVIFGNWDDLILADWAETSVIVDPYSLSMAGQVRIVVQMLCDNGIRHTQSFAIGTT